MQSSRTQMNNLATENGHLLRQLSDDESAALKRVLLQMYQDLEQLCEANHLQLMLCGGSCLGAVRHQGFIPWDDDLDVMMLRSDYEKLLLLLRQGALGDRYTYSAPSADSESANVFLKIYLRDSEDIELHNLSTPFPKGIFLDVFILDYVPAKRWQQKLKGLIADAIHFCAVATLYSNYPSPEMEAYMAQHPASRRSYRMKRLFGHLVRFIPRRKWIWWFDRYVASTPESPYLGIPTGRMYYGGEIFPREVFEPERAGTFEGLIVSLPKGRDAYLRNLYHDYMQLPPPEKRERHFIYRFKLPNAIDNTTL